jgi:hypothetical protein
MACATRTGLPTRCISTRYLALTSRSEPSEARLLRELRKAAAPRAWRALIRDSLNDTGLRKRGGRSPRLCVQFLQSWLRSGIPSIRRCTQLRTPGTPAHRGKELNCGARAPRSTALPICACAPTWRKKAEGSYTFRTIRKIVTAGHQPVFWFIRPPNSETRGSMPLSDIRVAEVAGYLPSGSLRTTGAVRTESAWYETY